MLKNQVMSARRAAILEFIEKRFTAGNELMKNTKNKPCLT